MNVAVPLAEDDRHASGALCDAAEGAVALQETWA